jgi:hypothetical protein
MQGWLLPWARWLEHSGPATALRTSTWAYPTVEVAHLIGLGLLVGTACAFDFRLLGAARRLPLDAVAAFLLPCARTGFAVMAISGLMLFAANASTMITGLFAAKLGAIAVAVGNASLFHRKVFRDVASWNVGIRPPVPARLAAVVSLACWTTALICGRLLAYL